MITGEFLIKFVRGMERAVFLFALPAALFVNASLSQYDPEHGFWIYYIILAADTFLLVVKEKFKSLKTKDLDNFKQEYPWYRAYSLAMVIQVLVAIMIGSTPMSTMALYVASLVLFVSRTMVFDRNLKELS